MEQEGLNVPYRVDRIAWAMALGSLLLIVAAIALLTHLAFSAYKSLYLERIHTTIASRDFKAAEQDLTALFRGPPVLGPLFGGGSSMTKTGKETISGLMQIMGTLSPKDLATAKRKLESLLTNPSLSVELSPAAAQILKRLEPSLESAAQLAERLERVLAEKAGSKEGKKEALTRYDLLAKDSADLFSLQPDAVAAQGDAPVFYQSGVLANLPSLQGLPDGLTSLDDLKRALQKVGGGVHLQGENVHEIFSAKLEELRTGGAALNAALSAAETTAAETDRQIAALSQDLDRKTTELGAEFDRALRDLIETISASSS